ncbi:MAG: hypothetical protein WC840_00660 [Candidatus Peribacteraceae bacterium]
MPLFTYRATNDDSKEVRGTIESPDIESAKRALQDLHLETSDISEAMRLRPEDRQPAVPPPPASRTTFAFEGKDDRGTVRRGTVEAETKHAAFERLKHDQKLSVTALSPVGITPVYRDYDLLNWQRKDSPPAPPVPVAIPSPAPAAAAKPLGFSLPAGTLAPAAQVPSTNTEHGTRNAERYFPLLSTIRLYAGWLLAWYALFVALGYYSHVRTLPWNVPFVEAFYLSPLIFTFVVAIFLFLMLTSLKRALGGGIFTGFIFTILGIGALVFVRMSVW